MVQRRRQSRRRLDTEYLRQIVAVVHVKAHRLVGFITRAHGREVQGHGTAQFALANDVIELVGMGGGDK